MLSLLNCSNVCSSSCRESARFGSCMLASASECSRCKNKQLHYNEYTVVYFPVLHHQSVYFFEKKKTNWTKTLLTLFYNSASLCAKSKQASVAITSTLIFARMPFSASLADDFTRAVCSLSESFFAYSALAESQCRWMINSTQLNIPDKDANIYDISFHSNLTVICLCMIYCNTMRHASM